MTTAVIQETQFRQLIIWLIIAAAIVGSLPFFIRGAAASDTPMPVPASIYEFEQMCLGKGGDSSSQGQKATCVFTPSYYWKCDFSIPACLEHVADARDVTGPIAYNRALDRSPSKNPTPTPTPQVNSTYDLAQPFPDRKAKP